MSDLLDAAEVRLDVGEGVALERLAAAAYHERSRRGIGDIAVSREVRGWWDRSGTEIDLVLVDDDRDHIRLVTCERSPDKLVADIPRFDGHVERFLDALPRFRSWKLDKVAVAPSLDAAHRRACAEAGYIPQDLAELTAPLA